MPETPPDPPIDVCDSDNKKIRAFYVTGTLKKGAVKVFELNESDKYDSWITYSDDGVILVTIRHGRKEQRGEDGTALKDDEGKPLMKWCKITCIAITEDSEKEETKVESKTFKTDDEIPQREDWRIWIYQWNSPDQKVEGEDICATKYRIINPPEVNRNLLRERFETYVDPKQEITINQQPSIFEQAILSLGYSESFAGEAKVQRRLLLINQGTETCEVDSEPFEVMADINGFNFSGEQIQKAKILGIAGWLNNESDSVS